MLLSTEPKSRLHDEAKGTLAILLQLFYVSVKSKLQHPPPPPAYPGIPPGRREFDHQSLPGGGEFDPHALCVGNLNCTLEFQVKSLVWRVIMGDAVLEHFCGKDCAFLASWLRAFK